jgi:hypothetical protein
MELNNSKKLNGSKTMVKSIDLQVKEACLSVSKEAEPLIFVIDLSDGHPNEAGASPADYRHSIVVRVEPEEFVLPLDAIEPERARKTFAEGLAQQTALLAIEKDLPNGVQLSFSAKQLDQIPVEFENRLPNLCVNGNNAWVVYPQKEQ